MENISKFYFVQFLEGIECWVKAKISDNPKTLQWKQQPKKNYLF